MQPCTNQPWPDLGAIEVLLIGCRVQITFQSPALALLRDLERDRDLDLDLDLERETAGLSRLVLLSRVRLTDQIRCLVSIA